MSPIQSAERYDMFIEKEYPKFEKSLKGAICNTFNIKLLIVL